MNTFIPQSIQTRIELEEIADAKKQIISPASSVTIYGVTQDGLIGAYNLTDSKTRINWRDAMNIMSYTTFDDFSKFEKNRDYSGIEMFSMVVPPKVTMKIGDVTIKDGEIVKDKDGKIGKIGGSVLGAKKKNNLLHYIWDEYGDDATINFIDNVQRLTNNFNLWNGFTVGVQDAKLPEVTKKEIQKYIEGIMNKVDVDITNIENNPGYMNMETFEGKIYSDLNVVRDEVSKIASASIGPENNFNIMHKSGSKGNANNLGQMTGAVGLQAIDGAMIEKMYNDRTLCYFHENDDRAKSRGLCYNSYMNGLTYSEFVYHTKAGRSGLITQVVKTSETGYAQRKLIKTMEDVMIKYDGTVRIANNQIIQHTYGGNGNNTTMQYEYKINMIEMDNESLENNFKYTKDELKEFSDFDNNDNNEFYQKIKTIRDELRFNTVKASLNYITIDNSYMLPINMMRILSSIVETDKNVKKISPKYIIESIDNLLSLKETPLIRIPMTELDKPTKYAVEDDRTAKTVFKAVLYDALNPKNVNDKYKLSKNTFNKIINEIKTQFNNNIVEPGEMVGIIAAESLGEAVTQLTISAFHHTGIASLAQSTSGVPRINELISASKNPKTPRMFVYLDDLSRGSREIAHKIGSSLEKTTLGNIRGKLDVYYDPNPTEKGGFMDMDGITEPFYSKKLTRNSCQANIENLPWLFRIEIDKEKMLNREVTLLDIKAKFCMWWDKRHVNTKKKKEKISTLKKITSFAMLSNTDSDTQPVIHIRFNVKDLDKSDNKKMTSKNALMFNRKTIVDFIDMLDKFKLKGIENINSIITIAKERFKNISDGNKMDVSDEQVIYTAGVNMKEIRYISGINPYRSFSDDIAETFNTFGIEFARSRLLAEFLQAYRNAGNTGINPQHISLLVDIMCYGGTVISADRHGMKKANIDPLTKASFEKPIDILISAAVFGDTDRMQGVSSRIYIGSVFKGGTGYCELILDTNMIQNSEYVETEVRNIKQDINIDTLAKGILEDENNNDNDIFIPE